MTSFRRLSLLALVVIGLSFTADGGVQDVAAASADAEQRPLVQEFTIRASSHAFNPSHIEVTEGSLVRITLIAEDVPHSFTIDEYRIAKRVVPGRSVTIEFCADRSGRFVFYCSLTTDDRCRDMRGELVVR
jgi:heme/copper-type cytochrome/quinol oxidase subunit 2